MSMIPIRVIHGALCTVHLQGALAVPQDIAQRARGLGRPGSRKLRIMSQGVSTERQSGRESIVLDCRQTSGHK